MLRTVYRFWRDEGTFETLRWVGVFLRERRINLLSRPYFRLRYGKGESFVDADWDNLLLLDSCRYDAFAEHNWLEGDLDWKISRGSSSWEFILENFVDADLTDTVYVTANPYAGKVESGTFYHVHSLLDEWDEDLQTVPPETVVEAAVEAHREHPDKRLIVHFMQPHEPYIGERGRELRERADLRGWDYAKTVEGDVDLSGKQVREAVQSDDIDITRADMWEAYCETLEIALAHVEELLGHLSGRTVISADHGEMIGERPLPFADAEYGHRSMLRTPELCKVPWFTIGADTSRETTHEDPIANETVEDSVVEDRLEKLGYKG